MILKGYFLRVRAIKLKHDTCILKSSYIEKRSRKQSSL